jgi:hypothetical protein
MSTLTNFEKRKFEKLLGMGSGHVLDFSNRTLLSSSSIAQPQHL